MDIKPRVYDLRDAEGLQHRMRAMRPYHQASHRILSERRPNAEISETGTYWRISVPLKRTGGTIRYCKDLRPG